MFLISLNYFRAIAILFIVLGHSYFLAGINFRSLSLSEEILINLITGGTTLFVFISGFLFHHIFLPKYQYKNFIVGKVKNVLIPYLILSIPIIFIYMEGKGWGQYYLPVSNGPVGEYIVPVLEYYLSGDALFGYWYIPFVMLTFLMAPIHVIFIRQKTSIQLVVIALFILISMLMQRPINNLYVFQSVLYFFPVYLIGILCSIHKEKIYDVMTGKELFLLFLVIYLAALEALLGQHGNYQKQAFILSGIDISLVQKLILSLFFMVWLHRFEKTANQPINLIASTSFGIFFLHGYFIFIINHIAYKLGATNLYRLIKIEFLSPWLLIIPIFIILIVLSILTVVGLKKIIPKYSRYIVGY